MKWISVKEKMPSEKNRTYLVYIDCFSDPNDAFEVCWYDGKFNIPMYPDLEEFVTHWMTLPKPPKK